MSHWVELMLTVACTVLASSGLWTFVLRKTEKNDATSQLLIGLAHDRILYLGKSYIKRGWVTLEEYENLHDYLYVPYEKKGGNGSAKRVMLEVEKLDLKPNDYNPEDA